MEMIKRKKAVSTVIIVVLVIVLILILIIGYFYLNMVVVTTGVNNMSINASINTPQLPASGNGTANIPDDVTISGFMFNPGNLSIKIGDTVTWTNLDSAPHTITSDNGGELASPDLAKGQNYSHTFTTAGNYTYHCAVHPYMKATIIVK